MSRSTYVALVVAGMALIEPWHLSLSAPASQDCRHIPSSSAPVALANDNRNAAGSLREGVLKLSLVVQAARWYPEGADGCGVELFAFAEEGKAPLTPGPLIRVPAGTQVLVTVRNASGQAILIRGLHDRSRDSIVAVQNAEVAPNATREFAFRMTTSGTWYYHAIAVSSRASTFVPAGQFSQAVGAFIVDSVGGQHRDRVFVMTRWRGPAVSAARDQAWEITAFNGRSWPSTERLSASVDDTVRWRVISANNDGHAIHLHGFYFVVESKGSLVTDTVYAAAARRMMVTEPLGPGRTLTLRWIPERPGNWIFHCHLVRHMSAAQRLDRMPGAAASAPSTDPAHASHALHEMAGLVMGITVNPAVGTSSAQPGPALRKLRLFANQRDSVFGGLPGYGFVLQEGADPPATDSVRIPGTPIILTRREPVEIMVLNRLREALAVHWHGIELESWFDGVAGWSGANGRIAPPLAPGDSFAVRFTPPRAGTFIYHVHNEAGEELSSGLYGPLIVLESGERRDPQHDLLFTIAEPGPGNPPIGQLPRPPFVNGSTNPTAIAMVVGQVYRLRFVAISANTNYRITLRRGADLTQWRLVARDGADVRPGPTPTAPAQLSDFGTGMTVDFLFTPAAPGELSLEVDPIGGQRAVPIGQPTMVPIRIRPQ